MTRLHPKKLIPLLCALLTIAFSVYLAMEMLRKEASPVGNSVADSSIAAAGVNSQLVIHVIDVGNADAILIQNQDRAMLIDAGENSDGDDVVTFLRRQGVTRLDYAIATHPDADHIGGMDVVIREIPVDTFIMSMMPEALTPTTQTYADMLEALDSREVAVEEAKTEAQYRLGQASFIILAPLGEYDDTNDMSVVCRLDFGQRRFLFMGDAEKSSENDLMNSGADVKADFIKLGHHGSSTSSQERFLRLVNPRYAAITCGAGNKYGHPHKETIARLKSLSIAYYRCDLNGTITVTSDGSAIAVTTEK